MTDRDLLSESLIRRCCHLGLKEKLHPGIQTPFRFQTHKHPFHDSQHKLASAFHTRPQSIQLVSKDRALRRYMQTANRYAADELTQMASKLVRAARTLTFRLSIPRRIPPDLCQYPAPDSAAAMHQALYAMYLDEGTPPSGYHGCIHILWVSYTLSFQKLSF